MFSSKCEEDVAFFFRGDDWVVRRWKAGEVRVGICWCWGGNEELDWWVVSVFFLLKKRGGLVKGIVMGI